MRRCLINDCNINEPEPALCCLDCGDRDICPDRCPKTETTFCVGVLENDCKGISEKSDQDPERD
jgi:hypothetical protein